MNFIPALDKRSNVIQEQEIRYNPRDRFDVLGTKEDLILQNYRFNETAEWLTGAFAKLGI